MSTDGRADKSNSVEDSHDKDRSLPRSHHGGDYAALIENIPVRVYLSNPTEDQIASAEESVRTLIESLDWGISSEAPPEIGSWFKKFLCKTKDLLTRKQFTDRAKTLERAFELQAIDKQQALADKPRLEGTAELLRAIGDNDAIVQIGSVLMVKQVGSDGRSRIAVRTLSQLEISFLEHNTALFKSPTEVLDALEQFNKTNPRVGTTPDGGEYRVDDGTSPKTLFHDSQT